MMEEVEGDIKLLFGEEDEDLRCVETEFIPLPLLIGRREIGHRFHQSTTQHLERWGEESFIQRQHTQIHCRVPASSKATYLLAFSPDGTKVASSHGDHNIYVTDVKTGKCICTLKGHPRSPWCVAFHPSSNEIVASGCLGGEVRVWDLKGGSEIWSPDKKGVGDKKSGIASLAFHPTDQVLVIATDNELYFWDWFCPEPFAKISTASKQERVKYVAFDPLGYKLITGIAIVRPERYSIDVTHGSTASNSTTTSASMTNSSDFLRRNSIPVNRCSPSRIHRFMERNQRIDSSSQNENTSTLSTSQRAALQLARSYAEAQSNTDRADRSFGGDFQEIGSLPGHNHLENIHEGASTSTPHSSYRRPFRLRPILSSTLLTPSAMEDEHRPGGAEFRPSMRPMSDDSASSSSLDSSSSVTSGVSGASHERNTRLSLLWTSRLNRGGLGGNESDNSAGGSYDLEERRGEGSVMLGGPRPGEVRHESPPCDRESRIAETHLIDAGRERDRERRILTAPSVISHRRRSPTLTSPGDLDMRSNANEEENDIDLSQRLSRNSGQGGRWMYYRGKFPGGLPPCRKRQPVRGPSGRSSGRSATSRSSPTGTANEDPLAVPGPSGLAQLRVPPSSILSEVPPPTFPSDSVPSDPFSDSVASNTSLRSRSESFLDPQFGVQLLSRHIENMQSICRSLYIPRARLETSRNRNEISQLEQIRSMLYDIQHQIRSLRASVDQTIAGDRNPPDESLNSASVNPEPLGAELLNSADRNLTDHVELEVNIGADDEEEYSFSTLADEDPAQLPLDIISNPLETPLESLLIPDAGASDLDPLQENEASSRASSSPVRPTSRISRYNSRALRSLTATRIRNRRNWRSLSRNRLVWTGLLRRLPSQRRVTRSRLPLTTLNGVESSRGTRRRDARDLRIDKRRSLVHGRRTEQIVNDGAGTSNTEPNVNEPDCNGQRRDPVTHVRRRHSGDWQRRLRSIVALDEQRQMECNGTSSFSSITPASVTPGSCITPSNTITPGSSATYNSSQAPKFAHSFSSHRPTPSSTATSFIENSSSSSAPVQNESRTGTIPSTALSASTSTTPLAPIFHRASTVLSSLASPPGNAPSASNNNSEEDEEDLPERPVRAGPPTTSLSSRIATMLAQRRELQATRSNTNNLDSSISVGSRPLSRPSEISRRRYDPQRRHRRNNYVMFPSPLYDRDSSPYSLRPHSPLESRSSALRSGANTDLSRPGYPPSLRSIRRELMISHRNRLLRRSSLVTGRDLAGATLAAIDAEIASEQERHREAFRHETRENYRSMLQFMADRLHQMMSQSFRGIQSSSRSDGVGRMVLTPEEEEAEAMELLNLRPSNLNRRRPPFRGSSPRLYSTSGSFYTPNTSQGTSALDRHMHNLRLLVRVALHLIYQLLNFICNHNLSYEERPISRLPNPFREEESNGRNQRSGSGVDSEASLNPSLFEMDIEPGLHNLTTLLETVRMASEELRQDALGTVSGPSSAGPQPDAEAGTRQEVGGEPPRPRQLPNTVPPLSASNLRGASERENSSRPETGYSGSAMRRRLTDFLIRTGGYSCRTSTNPPTSRPSSEDVTTRDLETRRRDLNPGIQRPQPTTPTVHLRDIRAPLPIPQIVLSDMSQEEPSVPESSSRERRQGPLVAPSEDLSFHLRTFGGIPLRVLGRQNAVDRRSPDSEDSNGNENNNNAPTPPSRNSENERSFSWYASPWYASPNQRQPFRYWNHPSYNHGPHPNYPTLNSPANVDRGSDREPPDQLLYFNHILFNPFINGPRAHAGTLLDHNSPISCNSSNSFYRIQAWDFKHFRIPEISDNHSNIVVSRCRIHFDASVSISADGTLLAAVLPDTHSTRIGVYSLESKSLGQPLYSSSIGHNVLCVSFSPTMRHLVVGISSQRLGVHHSEKQVIGRIYKLCHSPSSFRGTHPGNLKFCRAIELQSDIRPSSLNCIRWIPNPGHGLVYGTNRGQLTVIR